MIINGDQFVTITGTLEMLMLSVVSSDTLEPCSMSMGVDLAEDAEEYGLLTCTAEDLNQIFQHVGILDGEHFIAVIGTHVEGIDIQQVLSV